MVKKAEVPTAPVVPAVPEIPAAPVVPAVPEIPEIPAVPVTDELPDLTVADESEEIDLPEPNEDGHYHVRHKHSGEEFHVSREYYIAYRSVLEPV